MHQLWKKLCMSTILCLVLFFAAFPPCPVEAATSITITPKNSIQQALDRLERAGGGTLYITSGIYEVGTTVNVPNNVTIKGSGTTRPLIRLRGGLNIPVIQNKYVPFNDITIDFVEVSGSVTEKEMQGDTKAKVTGIQLTDRNDISVRNKNGAIYNSVVHNCAMGVIMGRTDNCIMRDLEIYDNGTYEGTLGYHNIYISSCDDVKLYKVNSHDCKTGMGIKLTEFYVDIYGNTIEDGIEVDSCISNNNKDRGLAAYDISNLTIKNSTFNLNGTSGLNILRCDGTIKDNTAIDNNRRWITAYDVWFNGCSSSKITFKNNLYYSYKWQ